MYPLFSFANKVFKPLLLSIIFLTSNYAYAQVTEAWVNRTAPAVSASSTVSNSTITLDNTSFKPDHDVSIAIGQFSTENADQCFYELVPVQGNDHDYFRIESDQLFLISNAGLSGKSTFKIKVRSTDPLSVYVEKDFTLTKTIYHPATAIKLVDAFSPNDDGINDTWIVPELRYYDMVQIEVFDRAGNRLFFTKDPEKGWDGRDKSGKVVPGAYFYMIRIDDIQAMKRGVLTVHKK